MPEELVQRVKYGVRWSINNPVSIEMAMIRKGGAFVDSAGNLCGLGLVQHYRNLITLLFPSWEWQRWSDLLIREFVEHWAVGVMGPASSGKTACATVFYLADYFTFPNNTTVLMSSTTIEGLERRCYGELKLRFKEAKGVHPWLPGHLTDSRKMLTTQASDGDKEIRDVRNGIICVAALQGGTYVGLGTFVGIKNQRMHQMADEIQFMPPAILSSVSNLSKNPTYKLIGLGNPKDRTDALGKLCEPIDKDGWDGITCGKKTQTWDSRFFHETRGHGRCVRLDGRDSPNNDYPEGLNPFKYLINKQHIESDELFHGENDAHVSMFDYAIMPTNNQAKRVISRQMCEKGRAFEEVTWDAATTIINIGCLDAAYSGVGGDRTVFIHLKMGKELGGGWVLAVEGDPIVIPVVGYGAEPSEQVAAAVMTHCLNRDIEPFRFFFDGTGRSSLTSALGRLWSPAVVPIEFGGKASNRPLGKYADCSKKYRKMVSELWFASRHVIEGGQLRQLPESVANEGYLRAWDISDGGFEDVEPKEDMKVRAGRSPDLYDAFVCGIEGARRLGFRIDSKAATPKVVEGFLTKLVRDRKALIQSYDLEAA